MNTTTTNTNPADDNDDVTGYLTADYGYALVLDAADTRQTILVAPGFTFGATRLSANYYAQLDALSKILRA
jgi:hypothetical protein